MTWRSRPSVRTWPASSAPRPPAAPAIAQTAPMVESAAPPAPNSTRDEHRHRHQQHAPTDLAQRIGDGEAAQVGLAQQIGDAGGRFAKQVAMAGTGGRKWANRNSASPATA